MPVRVGSIGEGRWPALACVRRHHVRWIPMSPAPRVERPAEAGFSAARSTGRAAHLLPLT